VRTKKYSAKGRTFLFFIFYFLLLAFCFLLPISSADASEIIRKIDIQGLYSLKNEELLDLLNIKAGEVFNPAAVRSGIKLAFLKGIFEDLSVEIADSARSHIIVKVKERDIIKRIIISGNQKLSKREIKKYFALKEEQVMRYDLRDNAVKELRNSLSERGFPHADIKFSVEKAGEPYRVNLLLTINEGTPEIIKGIKVIGPEGTKELIKTDTGDIYDQVNLRKELEEARLHYKKDKFLKPVVGPYVFKNGILEIRIEPGKKLDIVFENNTALSSKDLIKELPFFDAEDFRDDLIEEAVSRLVSLYHAKGYPFVQIAPVVTSEAGIITLRFFIFEGDKVIINSVTFDGITIPAKNLKEVMSLREKKPYDPDLIAQDQETLTEFYAALGYLNATIDAFKVEIKDANAGLRIKITEGAKRIIEDIVIKGALVIPKKKILDSVRIKAGDPYNGVDISDARYRIIDLYWHSGFIDAKVDIKQESGEKGIKIIFEIEEGKITLFGNTVVSGNAYTKNEVIKRELPYKSGEPLDPYLLAKTRQRLYKLGLFTEVDVDALGKEDSEQNVHIKLKEGKAGAVEFGVGYGDYERYRGSFDVSYRNLFGMNRQMSFRTEVSTIEQRYILNYTEPWFLGKQIPFKAFLIKEEKTEKAIETRETRYKLRRHTASVGLEKKFSERVKGDIYYDFSLVKTFEVKPDVILTKEDTGTVAISGIRPDIAYDSRDNPFDPRKGVLAGITVKAATDYLLSETDFIKTIISGSVYKELSKYFVVAVSLKSGLAQGFNGTKDLPLVERFFLGGRTTVRGYEQDTLGPKGASGTPTGGNAYVLTNLELRTYIGKGFGFVTFLDGGNVWRRTNDIKISEMKYTAGGGIRYNTPVGPLRVDYGHKLDRERGESRGEVHFSIGHAF